MAARASNVSNQLGLQLLLCPIGTNVVIRTACCTVGIALPVYSTFKAIEKKDRREQEKMLVYWAAFGSFSLMEVFSDKILYWVPFYYHMKFAFLIWLQLPSSNVRSSIIHKYVRRKRPKSVMKGSKHIYERHLRPFLKKHQAKLDKWLEILSDEIEKFISYHQREIQFLKAVALRCASTANKMVKDITQPLLPNRPGSAKGRNRPVNPRDNARGQYGKLT